MWMCGLFDHLLETSFDEFQWPPYGVNILVETRRALRGKPDRVSRENNVKSFRQIALPKCHTPNKSLELLVMVKSSTANVKQRDAIRRTWGARNRYDSVQTVFVVGKTADDTVQMDVQKEIERHGDILYIDSIDSYRNNTRKFVHSILFAFKPGNGCPSPEFLFLVDDDYMVNIGGILRHLSEENRYFHVSFPTNYEFLDDLLKAGLPG
ncbi:N-acetyllactosaminide 3-alpha-galactosyltransferase [Cooperia oncophora]